MISCENKIDLDKFNEKI